MPAAKRSGHEGRSVTWNWSDRGRSACTAETVRADLAQLCAMVSQTMLAPMHGQQPIVLIDGRGWL